MRLDGIIEVRHEDEGGPCFRVDALATSEPVRIIRRWPLLGRPEGLTHGEPAAWSGDGAVIEVRGPFGPRRLSTHTMAGVTEERVPPPRVKAGVQTRWGLDGWEKLTTRGWQRV